MNLDLQNFKQLNDHKPPKPWFKLAVSRKEEVGIAGFLFEGVRIVGMSDWNCPKI